MAQRQNARGQASSREMGIMSSLKPQGGLGQLLAQQGADPKLLEDVAEVEEMPGGMELLYTFAAEELMQGAGASKKDAKKVRLYKLGGPVHRAKGGAVRDAAETTRRAGRGDDSMMLHVSPEEYEVIEAMWGKAEINPNTGIGEYGFLSKIWKKVKKTVKRIVKSQIFQVVAPIALSIFVPGLGAAIGSVFTSSAVAAPIIGNALVQGGLSAAGGGDFVKGAVSGAITGGLGEVAGGVVKDIAPGISDSTAAVIGSGLAGGTAAELTGGEFMEGALSAGIQQGIVQPTMQGITEAGQNVFGIQDPAAGGIMAERIPPTLDPIDLSTIPPRIGGAEQAFVGPPAPGVDPYGVGGGQGNVPQAVLSETGVATAPAATPTAPTPPAAPGGTDLMQYALPALMMAGSMGGEEQPPGPPELPPWIKEDLPIFEMNRQFQGMDPNAYYTYGQQGAPQSGQHLFTTPEPFAGEVGTPTVGPTGGLGVTDPIAQMIAAGQIVPAAIGGAGSPQLQGAGYTQDPNTGDWMPPQQLGQGLPQARGGYQRGGEFDYWSQNADVPRAAPSVAASGRYVKGEGTGRSDDIPARLSDGEYVIDAESVSLLGDGSGDAGAQRLDEMRTNLRKHKATNLRKGGFSHKAKQPHQYMARGGIASLRRAATEAGRA
jgi:hypothetical protein